MAKASWPCSTDPNSHDATGDIAITGPETFTTATPARPPSPPRARGSADIAVRQRNGRSELQDLHQSGSMRVLFPRPATPPTAMLLNTAGGVTGGDRFEVTARAGTGARLTVTTQAAERAYRASSGTAAHVGNRLQVAAGARIDWLPQETILYDGSALHRHLRADLAEGAEALIVETLVFGRAAHGERLTNAELRDRIDITRDGRTIFADAIHLAGGIAEQLAHPARGNGAGALATIVLASGEAEGQLAHLRRIAAEYSGSSAGFSLLSKDLLVARALAHDSFDLRRLLLPILDHLTGCALPICWRL